MGQKFLKYKFLTPSENLKYQIRMGFNLFFINQNFKLEKKLNKSFPMGCPIGKFLLSFFSNLKCLEFNKKNSKLEKNLNIIFHFCVFNHNFFQF